jgi:Tfp pilus assembly protein PilO
MKVLIPLIALIASGVIFFGPTRGAIEDTKPLTTKRTDLNEALVNARKIQEVRESLQNRYNAFKAEDLTRLQKMIPSHVDNVRLVIDINNMAAQYGMTLKNIEIGQGVEDAQNPSLGTITGDGPDHLDMRFSVTGSYDAMKLFIADLGKSLRIVEVTDMTFSGGDKDLYDFSISIRTYWLQDK